jgi:DHA1 family bicyclomycin/chloramphenicol resistance-like MFS transporter
LLVFITQFLQLQTPILIGVHFLLLVPFSYLLFRKAQFS